MSRPIARPLVAALAGAALVAAPAAANFHLISIVEVYGGSPRAPDAQYVVLQMYAAGQNQVDGHALDFFDASGGDDGGVVFASDVPDGDDQATILIATSTAERLFGVEADLRMPAELDLDGGKVCFAGGIDCVSWGDYALGDVGTPYQTGAGLADGEAAKRRIDVCQTGGCDDGRLDAGDDTGDSADDFVSATPAPRNNAGEPGAADPDALFLHGFEAGTTAGWSGVDAS